MSAVTDEAGRVLTLSIGSCNLHPRVTVEETDDEVRLSAVADRSGRAEDACADGARVSLAAPLGARVVIDTSSGREVEVERR